MQGNPLHDWQDFFNQEFQKPYMQKLLVFLEQEYASNKIFPNHSNLFKAFELTPLAKVKIIILGQDPYHQEGQAHGLSFSVPPGIHLPPSLRNILLELENDLGIKNENKYLGDLTSWAASGVLLLNTTLTVKEGRPQSHYGKGWEEFTDAVVKMCNGQKRPLIFMLWGSNAKKKKNLIDGKKHYILEAAHPSPLSAHNGFFGCKHFSKANHILKSLGESPIDWRLK